MYVTADMLLMNPEQPQETAVEVVLVRAVLDGDRDGFARLYDLYAPLVHGILLARVPRAEVDDLVQDIFLHAFKKLHTLREASSFGPWIAMIARNRAVDYHRRSKETVEISDEVRGSDTHDSKAKEILDWQPLVSRVEGLKTTYDYFKSLPREELYKLPKEFTKAVRNFNGQKS